MCRVASAKSNDVHSNSYGVVVKIGTINQARHSALVQMDIVKQ